MPTSHLTLSPTFKGLSREKVKEPPAHIRCKSGGGGPNVCSVPSEERSDSGKRGLKRATGLRGEGERERGTGQEMKESTGVYQ